MKKIGISLLLSGLLSINLIANDKLQEKKEFNKIGFVSYSKIDNSIIEKKLGNSSLYKMFKSKGFKLKNSYKFKNMNNYLITDDNSKTSFIITNDNLIIFDKGMILNDKGELLSKIPEPFKPINMKKKYSNLVAFSVGNDKNPEIYVITDPDCPFCVEFEQKALKEISKKYKVNIILTSLYSEQRKMHPNSIAKIEDIMKEPKEKRLKKLEEIQGIKNKKWVKHDAVNKETYDIRYKELYKDLDFTGTPFIVDSNGKKL